MHSPGVLALFTASFQQKRDCIFCVESMALWDRRFPVLPVRWFSLSVAAAALMLCGCSGARRGGASSWLLPNMGQTITPLAPEDSRFEELNPDLPDKPAWLAGQAVSTVTSPD